VPGLLHLFAAGDDGLVFAVQPQFERVTDIFADRKHTFVDDLVKNVQSLAVTTDQACALEDREVF
jgi:hypothetical protein